MAKAHGINLTYSPAGLMLIFSEKGLEEGKQAGLVLNRRATLSI